MFPPSYLTLTESGGKFFSVSIGLLATHIDKPIAARYNITAAAQPNKKVSILTTVGLIVMLPLSLTQFVPSIRLAGYAVFVGVAFFFVAEAVAKTPKAQSGLRFGTFLTSLKKPGVPLWVLLPVVTTVIPFFAGQVGLHMGFSEHGLGRTTVYCRLRI